MRYNFTFEGEFSKINVHNEKETIPEIIVNEMNIYLITDLLHGKQYVGAEKRNRPEYFGSGKLIREAIEKFGKWNFKKEIIIDDKYIDSWEECLRLESACILSFNTLQLNGYNISLWNWPLPFEILSKAGKVKGEKDKRLGTGIFAPGMASKGGKIAGKRTKELGIGIFAPGMQSKGGKRGGRRTHELYPEEQKKWNNKARKIGTKMNVHILFEMDGLIQQATLGAISKI